MDAAAALKLSIREKRTKWSFLSPVTSVFTVFLLSSVLSSSPVNCDIIYSAAKESESSIPLIIEVLRYYENSGKVKSVNEQDVCHKVVEAVLNGFTENEFWATRSEWKKQIVKTFFRLIDYISQWSMPQETLVPGSCGALISFSARRRPATLLIKRDRWGSPRTRSR